MAIFGRPFVERFALCYHTVVCPILSVLSCPVCNVGILWPSGWMDQDETWHTGRPQPWQHCVRWGPSSPPAKEGAAPNFRPMYVVAKWLDGSRCHLAGREVSLSPSDIVLDGDPAPLPQKGVEPPIFSPCLLWPDGWMDQDATWHGGRSQPRPLCARWGPSSPFPKGGQLPIFGPYLLWPNGWMD